MRLVLRRNLPLVMLLLAIVCLLVFVLGDLPIASYSFGVGA